MTKRPPLRRARAFVAAAVLVAATPSNAKVGFTTFSGADLARICSTKDLFMQGTCVGYINGVVDVAERDAAMSASRPAAALQRWRLSGTSSCPGSSTTRTNFFIMAIQS